MARLRATVTVADEVAQTSNSNQEQSAHHSATIASSAFASAMNLERPHLRQPTDMSCDSIIAKTADLQLGSTQTMVCKKASPRKDARKQITLKPMNFANQDEDLSVLVVSHGQEETRQHHRKNVYSPIKLAASRLPSNTSFESMISDTDDGSDSSLPISLNSESTAFEFGARIPDSLVSPTKRQLFSPAKRRPVTNADIDDIASALATAKLEEVSVFEPDLEGSIDEPVVHETAIRSQFQLHLPSLLPSTWSSELQRPSTPPPLSPSKSKLVSPSKARCRIPTPPMKSSPNAFWSVEKVNDWNDQHSPQKIVRSPKKSRFLHHDEPTSPSGSPHKQSSPNKLSRAALAARRDFEARKRDIASEFLAELDAAITEGQISKLSEPTGGVQLIWSKTLNSTAGRANWRRETSRGGTKANPAESKHFASIELAEKVIDDETRLLNVLAHEFCHLANFMVSGIKDRPHGAEFKTWGRKCTLAFGIRGVEVTTKHTYDIDYKYIWACSNDDCQAEFKRHSKSIDPSHHTCGVCRAKLLQIKPVPRKAATGVKPAGYAGFVKEHYAAVKKDMPPGASQKDVMTKLGEKYRATKSEHAQANQQVGGELPSMELVTQGLETIVLKETNC